jgi:hypothetical protein
MLQCYVGIGNKCFEILECPPANGGSDQSGLNGYPHHHNTGAISVVEVDGDEDNENSEADDTEDDDEEGTTASSPTDAEDDFTEMSDDLESETDDFEEPESSQSAVSLRLREILFYDDKVAIFKARHGRL